MSKSRFSGSRISKVNMDLGRPVSTWSADSADTRDHIGVPKELGRMCVQQSGIVMPAEDIIAELDEVGPRPLSGRDPP